MNYFILYKALIERAKLRGLDKKKLNYYTERHHIVPKCMNGTNDKSNLVLLTGREHYLCHWLLWKTNKENKSLFYAYHKMVYQKRTYQERNFKISSRQYEILRSELNKGKKLSDITKKKISLSNKGKQHTLEAKKKISDAHKGIKRPEWVKEKISKSQTGINNPFFAKTHSDIVKKRLSEAAKRTPTWLSFEVIWNGLYFSSVASVCKCYNIGRASVMKTLNNKNIEDCFIIS